MKLIVFSDSHNTGLWRMLNVLEAEKEYNAVFFLGDGDMDADRLAKYLGNKPFYRVRGNCDYGSAYPFQGVVSFGGQAFLYTHGHKQGVKAGMGGLFMEATRQSISVVLFGHTHIPLYKEYEGFRFFNPGSVSQPRNGEATYGRISLNPSQAEKNNFEIVEVPY